MVNHGYHRSTMRRWSETAARIAATTRTSEKVATLADYLRSLTPEELPIAVTYMTGRPFPERDPRTTGIGWAAIAAVVEALVDAQPGALGATYNDSSDLGQAVGDLLAAHGHEGTGKPPTLPEVDAAFAAIAAAKGQAKAKPLRDLLARCNPQSAKSVVKVLSGDLRIGLREGHLEAAIAKAFDRPLADVQWAGMLTGDLGRTAELARDDELGKAELALFRPLKSMLASPVADEAEVLKRLGSPVWVEDKYDGIRAQLHKQGREVRLYSRDLHDISESYPEVVATAATQPWDGILDGEVLAFRDGMALPFLQLQARLGRKDPSEQMQRDMPVIYVAFDALALGAPARPRKVEPLLRLAAARATRPARRAEPAQRPGHGHVERGDRRHGRRTGHDLRRLAAARQRGPDGQGPRLDLLARPARLRLAEAQAAAGDPRLRGGRRGSRPWQAPRRPVRLHLRGPGRPTRRGRPTGDHRQGLLRPDGQGDRHDDHLVRGAHARSRSAASTWSSRRSWSRSRSTSSTARTATTRASRCASRASSGCATTRTRARSTR